MSYHTLSQVIVGASIGYICSLVFIRIDQRLHSMGIVEIILKLNIVQQLSIVDNDGTLDLRPSTIWWDIWSEKQQNNIKNHSKNSNNKSVRSKPRAKKHQA